MSHENLGNYKLEKDVFCIEISPKEIIMPELFTFKRCILIRLHLFRNTTTTNNKQIRIIYSFALS